MGANVAPSAGLRCGALHASVGTSGAVSKQLSVAGLIYCGGKYRCLCFGEGFLLLKDGLRRLVVVLLDWCCFCP